MHTRSTSWWSRTSSERLVWNGMPSSSARQRASSSLWPQRARTSKPSAFNSGTSTRAVLPVPKTPTPGNMAAPPTATLCVNHDQPHKRICLSDTALAVSGNHLQSLEKSKMKEHRQHSRQFHPSIITKWIVSQCFYYYELFSARYS